MTLRKFVDAAGACNRRSVLLGALAFGLIARPGLARQSAAKPPEKAPMAGGSAPIATPIDAPTLDALLAQVSQERLRAHVEGLSAFPTRWSEGPDFQRVEDWVADAFAAQSASAVITRQAYTMTSGRGRNNIIVGNPRDPRGVVLIGAHMDSISEQPSVSAPGANDNATGVSVLLEAHRLLSAQAFAKEIVFVAFSGEEQDLQGSAACAAIARREGWPIDVMINLDMLGFHPADPQAPVIIEYDQDNAASTNDAAARAYGLLAANLAAAHSTLATAHTDIWDSDYMPFERAGFVCIGFYDDGAESPEYHTTSDTADRVDFPRLEQVARIVVATLATVAGMEGPGP